MKHIISDFYKAHIAVLFRYAVIVAVCIGAFFLTGIFRQEKTFAAGVAVSVFLAVVLLWAFAEVLIVSRIRLSQRLNKELSAKERDEVLSGYEGAAAIGKRRFYKHDWLLFYSYRKIILIRYKDIVSADEKGANIFLTLADGKTVLMPTEPSENSAVIFAALKGYNNNIKFLINGKPTGGAERKDG